MAVLKKLEGHFKILFYNLTNLAVLYDRQRKHLMSSVDFLEISAFK